MPERRSQDGFTLIELMVVVLLIAVLISVAVPTMRGARTRSQDGTAKSNLRASVEVAASYATANSGTWPTSTAMTADETSMTYVGSSTASTAPNIVSVEGGSGYVAAAISASGTCWRVVQSNGSTTFSTKTGTCRAAAEGTVSTFAGSGVKTTANGTGTAASFEVPSDIAFDVAGNLYVVDAEAMIIRKITPSTVVTTFSGSGINGFLDGAAGVVRFSSPQGIVYSPLGDLYVADSINSRIRMIV